MKKASEYVDKNNIGDYSWLRTYLEKATTNPEQLSRDILDKAKELSNGKVMDDMTVVVMGLCETASDMPRVEKLTAVYPF